MTHPIQSLGTALLDSARPVRAVPLDIPGHVLGRIERHLAGLPAAERRLFLTQQYDRWSANYERFHALAARNDCLGDLEDLYASDFTLILTGIAQLQAAS